MHVPPDVKTKSNLNEDENPVDQGSAKSINNDSNKASTSAKSNSSADSSCDADSNNLRVCRKNHKMLDKLTYWNFRYKGVS